MNIDHFDSWLAERGGPAALVLRQSLTPVEGPDGIFFPPTFASGDGFPGGYNLDVFPDADAIKNASAEMLKRDTKSKPLHELFPDSPNVCLIDSVGSQANRIEPLFAEGNWATLIPQVVITAGEKKVNLVACGHRAGDALARCSALQEELHAAFKTLQQGDATALAKIAPTSLVFGVWDSRDTQAKVPRLVSSTVRAFNVRVLTRSAVYTPPVSYAELEVFTEAEQSKADGDSKSPLAKRGFVHNPASGAPGGVMLGSNGSIRRDATLSLAALRLLRAGADPDATLALRRYVLGLALLAFTANATEYLRQGCLLVGDADNPPQAEKVFPNGKREPLTESEDDLLAYAKAAAEMFSVGDSREVPFDKKKAKEDVKKKE